MKKFAALLGALAGVVLLTAQTPPASPAKPVEKEQPPIPGIVLKRPDGNQLGLTVVDGNFKLSFYDQKRKPISVDVSHAMLRWHPNYTVVNQRTTLNPVDDGKALGGGLFVRPPYSFQLYITLLKGDGDDAQAAENYVVGVTDDVIPKKK